MIKSFLSYIAKLPFELKRFILIFTDLLNILISLFFSFWIINNEPFSSEFINNIWRLPYFAIIGITIFLFTRQYSQISRFEGSLFFYSIALRNSLFVFCIYFFELANRFQVLKLNFFVVFYILLLIFTISIRVIIRDLLISFTLWGKEDIPKVAIYGAGAAGAALMKVLQLEASHKVSFFIDDNSELWNRSLNGCRIYPPFLIKKFVRDIDQILIAIPSIKLKGKNKILATLKEQDIPIFEIPSIQDLTTKNIKINTLKPISIEDLLGRGSAVPNKKLIGPTIKNCTVLVTGAGGSIGSELCRQILKIKPKKLILLDNSEFNLYKIDKELKLINKNLGVKYLTYLGSVQDIKFTDGIFKENDIDTIFHAAAYKHVPLVESNPISAVKNNIFSTFNICKIALKYKVRNFLLISSDKAVRPTNIMGVTKRVSELIVQAFTSEVISNNANLEKENFGNTLFSMVRFGNVLGSSGSVIPLFEEQIANGGPLTLTHENIYRYFMSIQEAVELLIQSSVLAKGGDVLLLDMGEPVQIKKLAVQMVNLSGLTIKDEKNPNGDIEILETGLRPGEKLYEELLIGENSEVTDNPLIFRAFEEKIDSKIMWQTLDELKEKVDSNNKLGVKKILKKLVPEWNASKI